MYQSLHISRDPTSDIMEFEIQNKLKFVYQDENGYGFEKDVFIVTLARRKGKNKQGPIKIFEKNNTSAYFRQSKNNILYLTVRKKNLTDKTIEQIKLDFAYYLSKIMPKKKIVLLYEKESSRYEESASVLYEKLIDDGYKDAYFILDKNYSHFMKLPISIVQISYIKDLLNITYISLCRRHFWAQRLWFMRLI